jgi:hypothetical protein
MYDSAEEGRANAKRTTYQGKKTPDDAMADAGKFSGIVQDDVSEAAKVVEDYRSKVFEYMKGNVNAALDYANSLASAKSPADLIAISARSARRPPAGEAKPAEPDLSTAAKAAEEYRARVFEIMKANVNATLEYAQKLAHVKSPAEFVELSTSHARKQFEAIAAQTAEIGVLTQKLATSNTERLAEGFTQVFTGRPKR